jgi:CTP:molybdopterin cytidylyltransferase MocA
MSTAAILLCAGKGSRFLSPNFKLREKITSTKTLLEESFESLLNARFDEVIVVVGDDELTDLIPQNVTVLKNHNSNGGSCVSLSVGLDWCHYIGHTAAVIGFGDEPVISQDAWSRLYESVKRPIIFARYKGKVSRPVRLDASIWPIIPIEGDDLERVLFDFDENLVGYEDCSGYVYNIDTLGDLHKWKTIRTLETIKK